jgi:hypothetical protein
MIGDAAMARLAPARHLQVVPSNPNPAHRTLSFMMISKRALAPQKDDAKITRCSQHQNVETHSIGFATERAIFN